ncbi:MAG: hypothetical protein IKN03_02420 [Fibrobacter sp.]|nr:hypothetical protein [Fibrobacter sp.]
MKRSSKFFALTVCAPVVMAFSPVLLSSCTKHPEMEDFKQIQLQWNAADDAAEQSEARDNCVIDITSKVMHHPVVLKSKLVEIAYEVAYRLDEKGLLAFDARCSDDRFADLYECSWRATCGGGSASVVKFHNER